MGVFTNFTRTKMENGVAEYETPAVEIGQVAGVSVASSMVIRKDEETAALNREATRLRDTGDIDAAIECLRKAAARMRASSMHHTIQTWLRLPLFLQQAGRYDEAMNEFQRLIDETPERNLRYLPDDANYSGGTPAQLRARARRYDLKIITEKVELATRREERRRQKATQ